MTDNPEIGQSMATCGYKTNYHDAGDGAPVLLLHGSGAGVSGWANWRGLIPHLAQRYRVSDPHLGWIADIALTSDCPLLRLRSPVREIRFACW